MTAAKRIMDVVFAALLLVILAPVIAVVALLLLVMQGRPILYVGERMKTPTDSFGLIKFRTMTLAQNDSGVSGADKSARITRLGTRLRANRLDELPQLWNILMGDLSFVGPRPPLRMYVEQFPDLYRDVLASRPGVTGLATLTFHKHEGTLLRHCRTARQTDDIYRRLCIPRKARLDIIYQRNRSLAYDFALAFQTIGELASRVNSRDLQICVSRYRPRDVFRLLQPLRARRVLGHQTLKAKA